MSPLEVTVEFGGRDGRTGCGLLPAWDTHMLLVGIPSWVGLEREVRIDVNEK